MFFFAAVTCPEQNQDPSNLYPDPEDCSRFYQCGNGIAYRRNCAEGTLFNANLATRVCDDPIKVR